MEGMLACILCLLRPVAACLGTWSRVRSEPVQDRRPVREITDCNAEETGVAAAHPIITPVACPVPGRRPGPQKLSGVRLLSLKPGALLARIYKAATAREEYFCNFEVNAEYVSVFEQHGLAASAFGEQGELRAVECPTHPFVLATLFQPQLGSTEGDPHPIVSAFLQAAASYREAACVSGADLWAALHGGPAASHLPPPSDLRPAASR